MKGPLARFRRSAEPAPQPLEGAPATAEQSTEAHPAVAAQEGLPAGQAPPDGRPSFHQKGGMRRRLRYLRRARELGFRDLGGLVFDQHRFERPNEDLVRAKVGALAAVDRELRALEQALNDGRAVTELREAGVSVCARCGALVSSDAVYCSACGIAQRGARTIAPVGETPAPQALAPAPPPVPQAEPAKAPQVPPAEAPTAAHEATPAAE